MVAAIISIGAIALGFIAVKYGIAAIVAGVTTLVTLIGISKKD